MIERYAKKLEVKGNLKILSPLMGHSGVQVTADAYGYRADKILAEHYAQYSWLDNVEDSV